VFGVVGPFAAAFALALAGWLVARRGRRGKSSGGSVALSGIGPALGLGVAFLLATRAWVGWPAVDRLPLGASDWAPHLVLLGALVGAVHQAFAGPRAGVIAAWVGRAAVIALVLLGPLARPRENAWEGTAELLWMGGVAAGMAVLFVSFDRLSARTDARGFTALGLVFAAGLIPAVFAAGATVQSQTAGGVAAALAGVGGAALIARGSIAARGLGTALTAWLTAVLVVSWQFVADMPWWEFGVIASVPVAAAWIDALPFVRRWSRGRVFWLRAVAIAIMCAAASGAHVPGLVEQMTGSAPKDAYGY
jgi:hypothetical protein